MQNRTFISSKYLASSRHAELNSDLVNVYLELIMLSMLSTLVISQKRVRCDDLTGKENQNLDPRV